MKAAFFRQHGERDVLEIGEMPMPEPGMGELRVKVRAVALNHLDIFVRRGWPSLKLEMPHIGASDASGIVDATGPGVEDLSEGDEVVLSAGWFCGKCAACFEGKENYCSRYHLFGEHRGGVAAEYFVAPERNLLRKPKDIPWVEAASLGVAYLTAWNMLVTRAKIGLFETVLINAASSGVSVAAIQIAKMYNARVIAVTGSPEKVERIKESGADEVIISSENMREKIKDLTGRKGVDLVLEHVGGGVFEKSIPLMAKGGRLVLCGATAEPLVKVDLRYLFSRHLSVLGATMGTRAELSRVLYFTERKKILPVVDTVLSLDNIAEGHRILEEKDHFGKVALIP